MSGVTQPPPKRACQLRCDYRRIRLQKWWTMGCGLGSNPLHDLEQSVEGCSGNILTHTFPLAAREGGSRVQVTAWDVTFEEPRFEKFTPPPLTHLLWSICPKRVPSPQCTG